jgi:hypothetical protein
MILNGNFDGIKTEQENYDERMFDDYCNDQTADYTIIHIIRNYTRTSFLMIYATLSVAWRIMPACLSLSCCVV